MSATGAARPADERAAPAPVSWLVFPVAVIAVAVVSGGALEFPVGTRTMGINTAQLAVAMVAVAGAWQAWRARTVRIDLLGLTMVALVAVPVLQGLRDGTGPMGGGGIGRFVTIGILLAALPQFHPDPPRPAGATSAGLGLRPWWQRWDIPFGLMGVALALLVLVRVVPAMLDPELDFYALKDVVRLPLGNHNYVAAILTSALAVALARPLAHRRWWLAAAGITALGLAATLSRGGWLVAGILLVVLAVLRRDRATLVVVGVLAGAAVVLLAAIGTVGGPDRLADLLRPATGARTDLWAASWRLFLDAPLLGIGVARFPDLVPEAVWAGRQPYQHAHNLVLETLSTTGIVGTVAYLAYWAGAAVRVLRLDDVTMRWRLGLPLLGLFLHAQIDSLNYLLVYEVVVATLVGVAACQPRAWGVAEVGLPGGRRRACVAPQ